MAVFAFKACLLRLARSLRESAARTKPRRHPRGTALIGAPIIADSRTPLWTEPTGERDRALTAGKIHNLRLAAGALNGVEVPAGAVMSFWRQVGRATRRRGFVTGRELREGCLIATTGGGLCQLSNALYGAALAAGFEIVERHAHSHVVPGSRAAAGRDATVFWNYVDLRFRSRAAFRIEARLTSDRLVVVFRALQPFSPAVIAPSADPRREANDCTSCGETGCHRHDPNRMESPHPSTAWLVDACWPEFNALFQTRAKASDALFLPTRRFARSRYGWTAKLCARERQATLPTLRRSLALRKRPMGAALQRLILAGDRALAVHYAARLSYLDTHLVVSQNLLPHLWRLGALQGRGFEVLMERLPLYCLQARLDRAAEIYPQSPTLADFRAPPEIVEAEREALAAAERLYTPHAMIAALDPPRSQVLPWAASKGPLGRKGGRTVLFPAAALGRKGAYALREALEGWEIDLVVARRAVETSGFWGARPVRVLEGPRPLELAAVVLPAIVEHQPRALLWALASGIPVVATQACGLAPQPGLVLIPDCDAEALRGALLGCLELPARLS